MNSWTEYVDIYCERTMPGMWNEPLNAVSNLAFVISAIVVFNLYRSDRIPVVNLLIANLAAIGIGSGLFHTFANEWSSTVDVFFIATYILIYLYAANRHFLKLNVPWSAGLTVLAIPYTPIAATGIGMALPWIGGSSVYGAINLLIYGYGVFLWKRHPALARRLLVGAIVLSVSIAFRTADHMVCPAFPLGTHWAWHLLNALMLGWMIFALRSHIVEASRGYSPETRRHFEHQDTDHVD